MSQPINGMSVHLYTPKYPHTSTHSHLIVSIDIWHWNCRVGICWHLLDRHNCSFWLQLEFVTAQTAGTFIYSAFLHDGGLRKRKSTVRGQNNWQTCFCVGSFSRWALKVVIISLWLLLQEPQKWAWGRERHFLQRALHILFWDAVGSQFPSRNCDLWPRQSTFQHSDAGPSPAQRTSSHAAAGRNAPQDWHDPSENLRGPWARGCEEESQQGEDDSGAGAGEMHPGFPPD